MAKQAQEASNRARVTLSLDGEAFKALRIEAIKRGTSASRIIDGLVSKYLSEIQISESVTADAAAQPRPETP